MFAEGKGGANQLPTAPADGKGKMNGEKVEVGNDVTADKAIRQALTVGIDWLCDGRLYFHHGVLTTDPYE